MDILRKLIVEYNSVSINRKNSSRLICILSSDNKGVKINRNTPYLNEIESAMIFNPDYDLILTEKISLISLLAIGS